MGNICRSPTAEGIFRAMAEEAGIAHLVDIDSAGTHGYHVGEPPDPRAQDAARDRGIEIGNLRARQFQKDDFQDFDYVLAMDRQNHAILLDLCPSEYRDRLHLFLSFAAETRVRDVPDPYYGNIDRFDRALDLIEQGAAGLLTEIQTALHAAKA
ncbi:MAG: low molecular weight phosphotyrosine protein phosphatase [Alphaproteobacteria bacterium]|nr:low molecular weight phosphotyrosine protein phosphatase [Alphaproteobacteria bacterium]